MVASIDHLAYIPHLKMSSMPRSSSHRSRDDKIIRLRRYILLVAILVVVAYTVMIMLLYSNAPRLQTDPELQPETHMMHLHGLAGSATAVGAPLVPFIENRKFKDGPPETGLVYFSAYQIERNEFWAVGLTDLTKHNKRAMDGCRWEYPNGTTADGKLWMDYPGEHHGKAFETVIIHCELDQAVRASFGGTLSMTVDKEELSVYSQPPGSNDWTPPQTPYPYKLAYCGSPMYGAIEAQRVMEWLEFHRITHRIDYFHIYDAGGVDGDVTGILRPYISRGTMDITDIRDTLQYDTWLYTQVMVVNDCALRVRHTSQWVLMMDIDEYLHITEVPHSLPAFLDPLKHLPWISFGSLSYSTDTCRSMEETGGQWAIEHLVFHQSDIHCRDLTKYSSRELCLKWDGHRKYVINPRRVKLLQIHRIMKPYTGGMDSHTSIAHLNHFRGLGVRNRTMCKTLVTYPTPAPKGLVRDFTMARMALLARRKGQ